MTAVAVKRQEFRQPSIASYVLIKFVSVNKFVSAMSAVFAHFRALQ